MRGLGFRPHIPVDPRHPYFPTGREDNTLRVWDLETGACLQILERLTAFPGCNLPISQRLPIN